MVIKIKPVVPIKVHNIKTVYEMLNLLKDDIGLTRDELIIIVYTSIDADYFTNLMIMQGEFLKWFTLNFAGESRDELDFLENKQEIWMATTTMAMEVVTAYGRLKENHEVILNEKWWQKTRFLSVGSQLCDVLNGQPDLMAEMRKCFKEQKDKMSYFDLFQFISKKMQIKLENWEEDALESRLDRLGMAFIEFNEFNEFTS